MTFDRNDRRLFDRSAEEYGAVRPGYPDRLIEDLIAASGFRTVEGSSRLGAGRAR